MSLYDKTNPVALGRLEQHRLALGLPADDRPRCYFCAQVPDCCLCGGGIAAIDHLTKGTPRCE